MRACACSTGRRPITSTLQPSLASSPSSSRTTAEPSPPRPPLTTWAQRGRRTVPPSLPCSAAGNSAPTER
eukprot:1853512-Prymnesium_polylepis.5